MTAGLGAWRRLKGAGLVKLASSLILPAAIGLALWIVLRETPELLRSLRLNPVLVGLSFIVECSGLLLAIPVWRWVLAAFGVRQSAWDDIRIYAYSALGVILPGGVWSIVSRSLMYQQVGASRLRVAAASVVETLLVGVASMGVYGLVTLFRPLPGLFTRPEVGLAAALIALCLMLPPVFQRLVGWLLKRSNREVAAPPVTFTGVQLVTWLAAEGLVTVIGGLAVYVLLTGLTDVPISVMLPVIAAWAAAGAASNLLFWLPGTPLLRDGAMAVTLSAVLPLPVAVLFVGAQRVWTILSLLLLAGLVSGWERIGQKTGQKPR